MPKRTPHKAVDLAFNLLTARDAAKMSQTALAKKAGIGRRNLQAYETGEKSPTVRTLDKIAVALDIPAAELLR